MVDAINPFPVSPKFNQDLGLTEAELRQFFKDDRRLQNIWRNRPEAINFLQSEAEKSLRTLARVFIEKYPDTFGRYSVDEVVATFEGSPDLKAAIAQIRKKVSSNGKAIDSLNAALDPLKNKATTLKATLEDLKGQTPALQAAYDSAHDPEAFRAPALSLAVTIHIQLQPLLLNYPALSSLDSGPVAALIADASVATPSPDTLINDVATLFAQIPSLQSLIPGASAPDQALLQAVIGSINSLHTTFDTLSANLKSSEVNLQKNLSDIEDTNALLVSTESKIRLLKRKIALHAKAIFTLQDQIQTLHQRIQNRLDALGVLDPSDQELLQKLKSIES